MSVGVMPAFAHRPLPIDHAAALVEMLSSLAAMGISPMKWLILLFVALFATVLGIMFTTGAMRYGFQIGFFVALVLSFVALSSGMFDASK